MIDLQSLVGDPYNRKARLQVALLVLLAPAAVALLLFRPWFEHGSTALLGLFVTCGGLMLLTQLARDRGKRLEDQLYASWGGKPSVAMLRHCDQRIDEFTKHRYRAFLANALPQLRWPPPGAELNEPQKADLTYTAASNWLLQQTREKTVHRLLFEENVNYGFRRNLYGLKPLAISVDVTLLVVLGFVLTAQSRGWAGLPKFDGWAVGVSAAIVVAHLSIFVAVVRPQWIRMAAEQYARHLLGACDVLQSASQAGKSS